MRFILVLQWPGHTEADFEALVEMEHLLDSELGPLGTVDGHDFGSGQMNIFIDTDRPMQAFAATRGLLGARPMWEAMRAASRETDGDTYELLWPIGLSEFSVS